MERQTGKIRGDFTKWRQFGGAGRDRTADKGFADLCLTTWRPRLSSTTAFHPLQKSYHTSNSPFIGLKEGSFQKSPRPRPSLWRKTLSRSRFLQPSGGISSDGRRRRPIQPTQKIAPSL